jgi:Mg2+ and Co2+ transporter CorA
MIIESGVYRDGHRHGMAVSLEATAHALKHDPDVFAWVDLYEPDPDEMANVRHLFGFPAQATECAGRPHLRA